MNSESVPTTHLALPPALPELWGGRAYRTAWGASTAVVAGAGAVVGLLAVPVSEVVGIATAAATFTLLGRRLTARRSSRPVRLVRLALTALTGTAGCVAAIGLVRLLGPVGLLLTALLLITSPEGARWSLLAARGTRLRLASRHQRSADATPGRSTTALGKPTRPGTLRPTAQPAAQPPAPAVPDASVPAVRSLTDQQLCLAWRISFTALQRSPDLERRSRLITLRQGYLDELERRNPHGFARWLYQGARPASDPSRYLLAPAPKGRSGTMGA